MTRHAWPLALVLLGCDGRTKDSATCDTVYYADADGDGHGDPDSSVTACEAPEGHVTDDSDCDDADADVHPDAGESCNGLDDDCDGEIDEDAALTWYADADGDGFGDPDSAVEGCEAPSDHVADASDCDDADPEIHPEATEECDEVDNDCDGGIDEGFEETRYYTDGDGDGWGDCDDFVDATCDPPSGTTEDCGDCDDTDDTINPGRRDDCNGIDDDCDGDIDEDAIDDLFLMSFDTTTGTVWEIDTSTGAATAVTSIVDSGYGINSTDVNANGLAVAHDYVGSRLAEIDACSGTIESIGATGVGNTCGIAFGPGGDLYGIDSTNDRLVQLDPITGEGTAIGPLGLSLGSCGLAYDCLNDVFIGANGATNQIFTVDPSTGAASDVVDTTVPFTYVGVEFDPADGSLLASTGSALYRVDVATGDSTKIGDFGVGSIDDLAFYPVCE